MKNSDRDRFDGRLKNASEAKQNRLKRFQAAAEDPERRAKRIRRDEAAVARKAAQQIKATKLQQEKDALEQQRKEEAEREAEKAGAREAALETEIAENASQAIAKSKALEAERKEKRDRRYAARQNRKR